MPHLVPTFFAHPARDLAEVDRENEIELDESVEPGSNFWWDLGLGVEVDVWRIPETDRWGWSIDYKRDGETYELLKYRESSESPPLAALEAEEGFRALTLALTSIWQPPDGAGGIINAMSKS